MDQNPLESEPSAWTKYAKSPTLIFSITLLVVYVAIAVVVGNFNDPLNPRNQNGILVFLLEQCDAPAPIFPWTLLTAIFLHASPLHIASNIAFLVIFGFILEEQVSKSRWMMAFFLTGLAGSLSFAASDLAGYFLTGFPNATSLSCGVGASGAVYGIMGTALGLKVVILLIFLLGLDLFAGGGFFAHSAGLLVGLILRRLWVRDRFSADA